MDGEGLSLALAGESLRLLPGRALWWPARRWLLVADVHIGKAQSFRRLGVPVPEQTTADTLARLDALLAAWQPARLVVLGDLLHARAAHADAPMSALAAWRARHAALAVTLVRGNHDAHAGDPPAALGIELADEPWCVGALALCHHPQAVAGHAVLAGHGHPCVAVGRGIERLRLPCFHLAGDTMVLPAFGAFTGMHPVDAAPQNRLFVVADDLVAEWPRPQGAGAPAQSGAV